MRTETLDLGSVLVNSSVDTNGRYWIASANGRAQFFRERRAMTRFLRLAKGTASRESLDTWVDGQLELDRLRKEAQAA